MGKTKRYVFQHKKTIIIEEVLDYTKWHGDAIVFKDKGGKHTLDNGRLICGLSITYRNLIELRGNIIDYNICKK